MERDRSLKVFARDATLTVVVAVLAGFLIPPTAMGKIDELLVTFLSIVMAAVIPGVALTAAAQRPSTESVLEVRTLGAKLETQVRFWFSFLWTGGGAIAVLLVGHVLDWQLITPRPGYIPAWMPPGGAWLVAAAGATLAFVVLRARYSAEAIISLISLGTKAHLTQAEERRKEISDQVARTMAQMATPPERGALLPDRDRRPRAQ